MNHCVLTGCVIVTLRQVQGVILGEHLHRYTRISSVQNTDIRSVDSYMRTSYWGQPTELDYDILVCITRVKRCRSQSHFMVRYVPLSVTGEQRFPSGHQ